MRYISNLRNFTTLSGSERKEGGRKEEGKAIVIGPSVVSAGEHL